MSSADLTEPNEVVGLFLKELQNNTVSAGQLRELLKQPTTYDNNTIWFEVTQNADVKAAFKRLQENLPASDYASRAWRRYHLNTDSVGVGYTSQVMTNAYGTAINELASSHTLQWNDLGETSSGTQDISFLDVTSRKITIPAPGLYRFMLSLCMGFFPVGYASTDFSLFDVGNLNANRTGLKFNTTLEIYGGSPSARTHVLPLLSGVLSRRDLLDRRKRFFGGSVEVNLPAGAVIQIVTQRAARMCTFSRVIPGTLNVETVNESMGFSKFIPFDAVNQQRDTQNWLEVARLA